MYSLKSGLDVFAPTTMEYTMVVSVIRRQSPSLPLTDLSGTISRYSKEEFSRNHLITSRFVCR